MSKKQNTKSLTSKEGQPKRRARTGVRVAVIEKRVVSPHVVNLKNPFPERFSNPKTMVTASMPTIPSPRVRQVNNKKVGVNFALRQASSQLSLVSFITFISAPLRRFFSYRKSESVATKVQEPITNTFEEVEDIFAPPTHVQWARLTLPLNWRRQIAVFSLTSFVLILPLQAFTYYQDLYETQGRVLAATNDAIESLKEGQYAAIQFDLAGAAARFSAAQSGFLTAQQEISGLNALTSDLIKLIPGTGDQFAAGIALLEAGKIIADIGNVLVTNGNALFQGGGVENYHGALKKFRDDLAIQITEFERAKTLLESIKLSDLPPEHRAEFEKAVLALPTIEAGLKQVFLVNDAFLTMLGDEQWQRYLVIFLNNNELRATGGFMGSFAIVDIDRGSIKKITIPGGGTYDIQGQLTEKVISPEPLHLINPRWEFQDSNWWSDYPTSAKKTEWFYQKAGGPSVDGVISITSTFMERLLTIFGPVEMPEYGRIITAENFTLETQKIVELEYDRTINKPKQFIGDLAPIILEKIFSSNSEQLKQLFETLKLSLNERHVLVYFNNPQLENLANDFGWGGELKKTEGDYLSIIHTNIAGGKTDGVIREKIEHVADVQPDGSIINTLTLTRRHTGIARENVFTGVQNNSYVRFYVPLGSTLISATGFKKPPETLFEKPTSDLAIDLDLASIESEHSIDATSKTETYTENGKTVFGNWLQLKPGEVQVSTIKYKLPFRLNAAGESNYFYSLLVQKQAGSLGSQLLSSLKLNGNFTPLAKYPATISADSSEIHFSASLTTDQFYGAVLRSN